MQCDYADQKQNRKKNVSRTSGTNVGRSQRLYEIICELNLVHNSRYRQPSLRNVTNSLIVKIQDGDGRRIEFRKVSKSAVWNLDEDISTEFGGQIHLGHMEMIARMDRNRSRKLIRMYSFALPTQYTSSLPSTTEEVYVFARAPAFVCLSVCVQDYSKTRAWIWMKCCVSTDVGTWTN